MKKIMKYHTSIILLSILQVHFLFSQTDEKIRISVSSDRVIPMAQREKALEIGYRLLNPAPFDLESALERIDTPFLFKEEEIVVSEGEEEPGPEPEQAGPKDDFEVLRLIAPRLQREVQGAMILGNRKRLIWSGGKSVEIGYTFQSRVSESDPNIYEISISDIQPKSFSIKLNDAEIVIPIGETSSGASIQSEN